MRKEELLWLYGLGERNFKRQNLRGKSFRGEDLSGADFGGSDIRGADFTNAILKGANFNHVQAGLQKRQAVTLFLVLLGLSGLLGLIAGFVGTLIELNLHTSGLDASTVQWVTVTVLIAFAAASLLHGVALGFSVFIFAFMGAGVTALASSAAVPLAGEMSITIAIDALVAAITLLAGTIALAAVLAFKRSAAVGIVAAFALSFSVAVVIARLFASADVSIATIVVAATVMILSLYIGKRARRGDRRHLSIWMLANTLASLWGTSFRNADLTSADFTHADLKSTDFRGAILINSHWSENAGSETPLRF